MHWYVKTVKPYANYAPDQDRFGALQMIVAAQGGDDYQHMIMTTLRRENEEQIYLGLPRRDLAKSFPDYVPVAGSLPEMTLLLLGEESIWPKYIKVRGIAA